MKLAMIVAFGGASVAAANVAAHLDTKSLTYHGWSADKLKNVVEAKGLGMCQGDCDSDLHCRTGLKCFHSNNGGKSLKIQTGCEGKTYSAADYCYKPAPAAPAAAPTRFPTRNPTAKPTAFPTRTPTAFPTRTPTTGYPTRVPTVPAHKDTDTLTTHGYNAHMLANVKAHGLGMCQGDCDSDSQCRGSMVCFHSHHAGNTVTGCEGKTLQIHDYCYKPPPTAAPTRFPTRTPTAKPTARVTVAAHKDTDTLTTHGYSADRLANVKAHGLGMCQGDCDYDSHCRTGLKCYHSSTHGRSLKIQTGCEGKTEGVHDYCYKPPPTAAPTRFPTRNPTAKPTAFPTRTPTAFPTRTPTTGYPTRVPTVPAHKDTDTLTTHGYNAHMLANVKAHGLGMCQGDCDSDSQCRGSMVCFHSHHAGNTVTGCEGKTLQIHDYCYKPPPTAAPTRFPTRTPTAKPTARVTVAAHKDTDTLTTHGYSAHMLANVKAHGLGMCQGDCDSDSHCRTGLKCFHSHSANKDLEAATGCAGRTEGIHDYCYASEKNSPLRCVNWDCSQWCKYFDQATEDAGLYTAAGCPDDSASTCSC